MTTTALSIPVVSIFLQKYIYLVLGPIFLVATAADAEQEQKPTALLERVGSGDRLDRNPGELGVGQQRVALTRMLANDPAEILADEPTGNPDPETGQRVIQFLEEFNEEGRTIIRLEEHPLTPATLSADNPRSRGASVRASVGGLPSEPDGADGRGEDFMADKPVVADQIDVMFRAFCERTRWRILSLLRDGELCVGDLVAILQVPQPKVSRHLAQLRRGRLGDHASDELLGPRFTGSRENGLSPQAA